MAIELTGLSELIAGLAAQQAKVDAACGQFVTDGAHLVQSRAMQLVPVVTGTLRRSFVVDGPMGGNGQKWSAEVYPSVIYGRRIELGFHGADSLGRQYDQDGEPYLQPAIDQSTADLEALFTTMMAAAVAA